MLSYVEYIFVHIESVKTEVLIALRMKYQLRIKF